MKKALLLFSFLFCFSTAFAQTFFEGFENTTAPDALPSTNWTLGSGHWAVFDNGVGLGQRWGINSVSPYQGTNAAYIIRENIGAGNTSKDFLATPAITIPSNGVLKFSSRTFVLGNQATIYEIYVAPATASQTDINAYTPIAQYTESEVSSTFNIYEEKTLSLATFAGTQIYIAFVMKWEQTGTALGDRWLVDNVSVTTGGPTTCAIPNNLTATYISNSSASLSWTENGTATQWEVLALPFGSNYPSATTAGTITNSPSYTFTGLTELTNKLYVRSVCGTNDKSDWVPLTYITPACQVPTNVQASNISGNGALVSYTAPGDYEFEVLVVPTGEPAPTTNTTVGVLTSSTTFSLSNLNPNTTYDVYVRSICGSSNNVTSWSIPAIFTTPLSLAPLVTVSSLTSQQLVTDILLDNNPCVTVSNISSSTGTNFGSVNGLGYFTNTNSNFPISSGIVLSTGNGANAAGPNTTTLSDGSTSWPGDAQLLNYMQSLGISSNLTNYYNASKLEFDFSSLNEFMSFNFLFASEEYGTFQCSYTDAFAFFLTDLNTNTTTNLALVPGTTTPISVTTIRDNAYNVACASSNEGYFGQLNPVTTALSSATNFNGQTKKMTASSAIIPGHNYHIKLVIADLNDTSYDSAIFIEAGSFSTGPPVCSDKVQLVAFVDANNNGIKDTNEFNFNHGSFVIQQNNTGPITNTATPSGTYTIYDSTATTYDFSYSIDTEYSPYYAISPTAFNDITIAANPNQVLYFPITQTQTYNDVMVSIIPINPCVAGFGFYNKIIYRNLGIATTSGSLTFTKDPLLTISYIYQSGTVATTDGFTYAFNNLGPFESRYFYVQLAVPTIPTVAIGDVLTNSATITAPSNDVNLTNNNFTCNQIVGASYDPNDKMESHGEKIPFNQFAPADYLYYTIRFQNTGTSDALTIRITDTLDAKLDETSVSMVDASHDYVLERVNNQLTWKFNYINLVGALENEELSKGYVTFKVKLKPGFTVGDIVPNKARIYFDTNPAIVTNTFNTEFVQALQNPSFSANTMTLYPNPASNTVQIANSQNETITSVALYEVSGKLVKQLTETNHSQLTIDLQNLAKGMYFVEITTASNTKQIKKLIIQ